MNKIYTLLITSLLLISCNDKVSQSKNNAEAKPKTENIEVKQVVIESVKTEFSDLYNVELVGLTKNVENGSYTIDFNSACMCDSPSILIKEEKVYLFGYCKDKLPPESKDPFYTYNIITKQESDKELLLMLEDLNLNHLMLIFKKTEENNLYILETEGNFPNNYIGNSIRKYFTNVPKNFRVESCGDFGG